MGVEPTWDALHPTDGFEDRGAHRDSSTPKTYPKGYNPMGKKSTLPDQAELLLPGGKRNQSTNCQPVARG